MRFHFDFERDEVKRRSDKSALHSPRSNTAYFMNALVETDTKTQQEIL